MRVIARRPRYDSDKLIRVEYKFTDLNNGQIYTASFF